MIAVFAGLLLLSVQSQPVSVKAETVSFQHRDLTLGGVLYRPEGPGPFPAVLYNHGSAPGNLNDQAFEQLGPLFVQRGWVFFAPYRRGQGLSSSAGPYIGDVIRTARNRHAGLVALGALPIVLVFLVISRKQRLRLRVLWALVLGTGTALAMQLISSRAGAEAMVRALENEHLSDQLAALEWLNKQEFVVRSRIATAGNSFGGVEVVLGAARASYCAGVVGSGGAESWATTPQLREVMARAARGSKAPIFFFQAENDYDIQPSRVLSAVMSQAGKIAEVRIYPKFGNTASEGHAFAWAGSQVWADDVFAFLEAHCSH